MAPTARNASQNEKKSFDDFPNLKKLLPPNYDYFFENCVEYEPLEGEEHFIANFRINQDVATKENVRHWIDNFCSQSLTTFRIDRTYPNETAWYVYRVDLRCQHNTKPTSHKRVQTPHKKHTACPAKMIVKIRQDRLSKRKRHETHLKTHPVEVILHHQHNHPIRKNNSLKYRDPRSNLVEKFHKMYQAGYKPSAALEIHKRDLRLEYEDNFASVSGDRGLCPDINWCYRQFDMFSKSHSGASDTTNLHMQTLHEYVCEYNKKCGKRCAAVRLLNDMNGSVVVALLSPLMGSAHLELKCSANFILIESLVVDYLRCKVYVIMTHTGVCKVPLGTLIVSSDSASVLKAALRLYVELIPNQGFHGSGRSGPCVIMVEDDDIQRDALKEVFPLASLFLSPYHIIQKAWAYLWETPCNSGSGQQVELIEALKNIICSENKVEFENSFEKLNLSVRNSRTSEFFCALYNKKCEWAACFREDLKVLSDNSLKVIENCLNSLQERYLWSSKSCTMVELLDFLTNDVEDFYKERLCKFIDCKFNDMLSLQYNKDKKLPDTLEIIPYFKVRNITNGSYYEVDMKLGLCSCSLGRNGSPCQHQHVLTQNIYLGPFLKSNINGEGLKKELRNVIQNLSCENESNSVVEKNSYMVDISAPYSIPEERMCLDGYHSAKTAGGGEEGGDVEMIDVNMTGNLDSEMPGTSGPSDSGDPNEQLSSGTLLLTKDSCNLGENSTSICYTTKMERYPCHICGRVSSSLSRLERHKKLHNHNKPVVCDICGLGYKSRACLKNHFSRNHSKKKSFECEICGKKFKRMESVVRHKEEEHITKSIDCMYCRENFTCEEDLANHVNDVHEEGRPDIILEVKNQMPCQLQRQDIKEIIIIDTEGQLPFHM